jgi:hypothetical protein
MEGPWWAENVRRCQVKRDDGVVGRDSHHVRFVSRRDTSCPLRRIDEEIGAADGEACRTGQPTDEEQNGNTKTGEISPSRFLCGQTIDHSGEAGARWYEKERQGRRDHSLFGMRQSHEWQDDGRQRRQKRPRGSWRPQDHKSAQADDAQRAEAARNDPEEENPEEPSDAAQHGPGMSQGVGEDTVAPLLLETLHRLGRSRLATVLIHGLPDEEDLRSFPGQSPEADLVPQPD